MKLFAIFIASKSGAKILSVPQSFPPFAPPPYETKIQTDIMPQLLDTLRQQKHPDNTIVTRSLAGEFYYIQLAAHQIRLFLSETQLMEDAVNTLFKSIENAQSALALSDILQHPLRFSDAKMYKIVTTLAETKESLNKSIEKALARQEKIDSLLQKTAKLSETAFLFPKKAKALNNQYCCQSLLCCCLPTCCSDDENSRYKEYSIQ